MRWRTHRSIAVLKYSLLACIGFSIANIIPSLIGVIICSEISILPDRIEKPLKLKHRGPTHSFLALATIFYSTAIMYFLFPNLILVWAAIITGYLFHLIADSLTDSGIPLLWPKQNRFLIHRLWWYDSGKVQEENLTMVLNVMAITLWIYNFWRIFYCP